VTRALYDTDVVLDVLASRHPHYEASRKALAAVADGLIEGFVAAHAVPTLHYLLRKQIGSPNSLLAIENLLLRMRVAPVTESVIRDALASSFTDFEDAVTHAAGQAAGVEVIVTRNIGDYTHATLPVVRPQDFDPGKPPASPTPPP
jgi:predicted nucleic acid-binding protein